MLVKQVLDIVIDDLAGSDVLEFPVSTMSSTLAHAISTVTDGMEVKPTSALDVGSGNGVHAFTMAALGIPNVMGIDISKASTEAAAQRAQRLNEQFRTLCKTYVSPELQTTSLDDFDSDLEFDLITFNPPGYFRCDEKDTIKPPSPVEAGVYDGFLSDANNPETSMLYRFFGCVVAKHLRVGGTVVATWPGLQRRVVEGSCDPAQSVSHPTNLLNRWFGWQYKVSPPQNTGKFYCFSSTVFDYGLGEVFTDCFVQLRNQSDAYSSLVTAGNATTNYAPQFKYGVLVLRKLRDDSLYWDAYQISRTRGGRISVQ